MDLKKKRLEANAIPSHTTPGRGKNSSGQERRKVRRKEKWWKWAEISREERQGLEGGCVTDSFRTFFFYIFVNCSYFISFLFFVCELFIINFFLFNLCGFFFAILCFFVFLFVFFFVILCLVFCWFWGTGLTVSFALLFIVICLFYFIFFNLIYFLFFIFVLPSWIFWVYFS